MDLDNLIEAHELTWRDILFEVTRDMDPWDINIGEVASRYSRKVGEMREMNFRIPANVVLVCSVLLRMKADIMNPYRKEEVYIGLDDAFNFIFSQVADPTLLAQGNGGNGHMEPELEIKPQRLIKRRVTAVELIAAIQSALEERTAKKYKEVLDKDGRRTLIVTTDFDITKVTDEIYKRVTQLLSMKDSVLFSELAKTKKEIVFTFVSLLHLWHRNMLSLSQEQLYEEIYIHSPGQQIQASM